MATEDFFIDNRGDRQAVKAICKGLPKLDVISPFALVVKTIYPVYAGAFVIAAQQEEVLRIFDFVCQQQAYRLQGLLPSVNVITQEQVVRLGRKATVLKKPQQVGILAVYVAADLKRRLQFQ